MKRLLALTTVMLLFSVVARSVNSDYTNKMSSNQSDWTNASGTYNGGVEKYNGNTTPFPEGDVLYQTISDLPNGYFEVEFYAWENFSNWDNNANIATGSHIAQVFANISSEDIYVIKNTGGRSFDDANKYTLLASVTDGTLKYGIKNIASGGNWAVCKPSKLTYLGPYPDDNTDLTSAINNYNFINCANNDFPGWIISAPNGGNTWKNGDSYVEYWIGSAVNGNFDYYQTLTGIPDGKYSLSASMWNSTNGEEGTSFNGGGTSGVYGTSSNGSIFAGVTNDSGNDNLSTYTTSDGVVVTDGELRIGVKNNTTMTARWFGVDWIKLNYEGRCIVNDADALPTSDMTANTWYYFDIVSDGDYSLTTTNIGDIVYTKDGTQLISNPQTSNWNNSSQSLTEGRYYVKSSSEQTLTVQAQSYTYTVGSATADYSYLQGGETVTVAYNDAITNNASATFDINGTPVITFNNSAVNVTATAKGFTFTVPSGLTTSTDYTLSIPADAFGYAAGNTYNEAQTITFHTPALFDGTYYFKVAGTTTNLSDVNTSAAVVGKYLARSNDWGTHAAADNYGLAISVTTDNNNYSLLQVYDTKRWYFTEGNWDVYSDGLTDKGDSRKMIISKNNGKLLISGMNSSDKYFKCNNAGITSSNVSIYYDGTGTNSGPILLWEVESPTDHQAVMASYKDAQAVAAATAAVTGDASAYTALSSVTTLAELESAAQNLGFSGVIIGGNAPTSVKEKYQGGQPNPAPETVYSDELVIPEPGLYKFSMQAFYRSANNEVTQDMHTKNVDCPPVVLFLGEAETQIKSVYDESSSTALTTETNWTNLSWNNAYYPNDVTTALKAFQNDMYHNDVWFYFNEAGTYTYGVKYMGFANDNAQWFIYSPESVTVTYYGNGTIRVVDGIVTVLGNNPIADINAALTSDIAVLNLKQAGGLNNATISTTNNPNLLIYANANQVSNHNNVIVNGTCAKLVLSKQNSPFFVPEAFTATSAIYTVASADLAGGEFATLMIPFAGSVPTGKAYTLDQGVNALGGEINATEITTVPTNSPVLVTGSGQFTTSNVEIPVIAKGATFTSGELVGVYQTTQAPVGSYVLQNHASSPNGVAFYLVNDVQPNVRTFRAYIKSQSNGAKAYRINFGGESTGIANIDSEGNVNYDNAEFYTLGGARIDSPQKGVNIVKFNDGTAKKVIIK